MRHTLMAHPSTSPGAAIGVEAEIARRAGLVTLTYRLTGEIDRLLIPPQTTAARTDELWRTTCLEAFVQPVECEAYVELNLAPSGAWAAYRFDAPRQNMRSAELTDAPSIGCRRAADRFELSAQIAFCGFPASDRSWRVGLTAVVEEIDGRKSYFALVHPSGKPDFHDSRGFLIETRP